MMYPDKLRFNPFEIISLEGNEPRVLSHIDRLKATFASAFPMQDILPVIMEHLLYDLYTNKRPWIDKTDPGYEMTTRKKIFPRLSDVMMSLLIF